MNRIFRILLICYIHKTYHCSSKSLFVSQWNTHCRLFLTVGRFFLACVCVRPDSIVIFRFSEIQWQTTMGKIHFRENKGRKMNVLEIWCKIHYKIVTLAVFLVFAASIVCISLGIFVMSFFPCRFRWKSTIFVDTFSPHMEPGAVGMYIFCVWSPNFWKLMKIYY